MKRTPSTDKVSLFVATLTFIVAIGIIAISTYTVFKDRQHLLEQTKIRARTQAELLGRNAESIFFDADLVLLTLRSNIGFHAHSNKEIYASISNFLKNQRPILPQIEHIYYFDKNRQIVYADSTPVDQILLSTFAGHQDKWLEFTVGELIQPGEPPRIYLSRRVENTAGEFAGVVIATLDPSFLAEKYEEYLQIDVSAIGMFDNQGNTLLYWSNLPQPSQNFVGKKLDNLPIFNIFKQDIIGGGGRSLSESSESLVASYQLSGFPFQVAFLYNKDQMHQQWLRSAGRELSIIAISTIVALFTSGLAFWNLGHRRKAEQALIDHQNELEATVDERTRELTEANTKLTEMNDELRLALENIHTLKGMLPICCYCKKIRNDSGYWSQIESYIRDHTDAEFSHGICPDCLKKHYPEV